jgi:hypothetical protein
MLSLEGVRSTIGITEAQWAEVQALLPGDRNGRSGLPRPLAVARCRMQSSTRCVAVAPRATCQGPAPYATLHRALYFLEQKLNNVRLILLNFLQRKIRRRFRCV